jgi:hypothetical protein
MDEWMNGWMDEWMDGWLDGNQRVIQNFGMLQKPRQVFDIFQCCRIPCF